MTLGLIAITERLGAAASGGSVDAGGSLAGAIVAAGTGPLVREVIGQTLALPLAPQPWAGYLAVDSETESIVGTCAFKSARSSAGSVEIAYFTFAPFEGQGYATAMAAALLRIAQSGGGVRRVTAQTLPERNASNRILEKLGFEFAGEVEHPEDGTVWEWSVEL